MKSFLKIYVMLSTGLVLSTAQNYQEPPIQPQLYNQLHPTYQPQPRSHQPLNHEQWRSQEKQPFLTPIQYQQKTAPTYPSSERNNHQPLKNFKVQAYFNNAKHPPHDYDHPHVIRKITLPVADVNNDKESHVIYLPVNGDPKDVKIVHFGSDLEEPYDDSEMSEAVKEVVTKALAVNRGEAKIIHEYNAQSTNQLISTFITSNDAEIPLPNTDKPSENLVTEATTVNAATDETAENAATDEDESTEAIVEDTVIETTAENEEIKTITENIEDKTPVKDTTNCNLDKENLKSDRTTNKITFEDIKQVISSEDAATSKDEPLDTVTFLVSLVRTAFQGSDSLKKMFQEPRVQEFVQPFYSNSL